MTELNEKKEQIIGILCYVCCAVILVIQSARSFSIIYFLMMAIVLFFSEKIFENDIIKNKTLTALFIILCGYHATFEIFISESSNNKQLLSATAAAVFFACIFAITDPLKMPYCIVSAPALCFLDLKIAVCYSTFLFCWSIVSLQLNKNKPKQKKSKNNNKVSAKEISIISTLISLICFGISIYMLLSTYIPVTPNLNYFLTTFKNPAALIVVSVYLAMCLFRSNFNAKISTGVSLVLFTVVIVIATLFIHLAVFALLCLCIPIFLGLFCIQDTAIIESMKADYEKNKFIFWVISICAIQ